MASIARPKTQEVTRWILLQFVSFPRFSLAPATSDEITTLAINRRVASSNLARGANPSLSSVTCEDQLFEFLIHKIIVSCKGEVSGEVRFFF